MAEYIDALIMFCAGVWATSAGFGEAPPAGGNTLVGDWHHRFVPMLRIIGPLLMLIAAGLAGASYFRPPA